MDVPETVISLVVSGILGGIGYGFRVLWNTIQAAAARCERDREALWIAFRKVEQKIDDCPTPDCPARRASATETTSGGNTPILQYSASLRPALPSQPKPN